MTDISFFSWDKDGIRWFIDASAYTGFHKALAQKIVPYLEPGSTLCDAGCGIGRLDLELARHVKNLTAIDVDEDAIKVLSRDAESLGLSNLRAYVHDAELLTEVFDTILLSFFRETSMPAFLKLCRRRIIRIVGADNRSNLYPENHRFKEKNAIPKVQDELISQGIGFKLELAAIEFGQPLVSWRDAELYVLKNAPEATDKEIGDFLSERLVRTGREDFPYYLPNEKEFGIFIIDKEVTS